MGQYDRFNQLQLDIALDLLRLLVEESQFAAIDELTQYVREMLSDEIIRKALSQQTLFKPQSEPSSILGLRLEAR